MSHLHIFGVLVSAVVLAYFPEIAVKGVGWQLAYVGRGGQNGAVHKVNAPTSGKEIPLFAY